MSDEFQLSDDLFQDLKAALIEHDSRASDDLLAAQYFAAMTGYIMAHQQMAPPKKRELLGQLNEFSGYVLDQVEQQTMPPPPSQDAFGIWRPGDA